MKKLFCGDTLVAIRPLLLPPAVPDTATRHQREQATVQAILRELGLPTEIAHHPDGSPYLPGYTGFISISHSQESVAVALNPLHRIGIDTETWRPQLERVRHKFLSPRELEIYQGNPGLLVAWCMKEAAYKAAGIRGLELTEGIRLPDAPGGDTITIPSSGLNLKVTVLDISESSATILCVPV